jgi:hypothetical protein
MQTISGPIGFRHASDTAPPAIVCAEFIARRRQKRLLDLMGKLEWDDGFDYKAERTRRS